MSGDRAMIAPEPNLKHTTDLRPGMHVELQPARADMHGNRYRGVVAGVALDEDNAEARYVYFRPGTGSYRVNDRPIRGHVVKYVHTGRCAQWLILPAPPEPQQPTISEEAS